MVARLKGDVTVAQAAADADRVAQQIMRDFPISLSAIHIKGDVAPLREYYVANVRPLLRTLFFAVAIVLLIACINVAGLLLVRATGRKREIAIRAEVGANRVRIMRQLLTESVVLSLAGGAIGLAFGTLGVRALLAINPGNVPRIGEH